jgi:hypothetical protein
MPVTGGLMIYDFALIAQWYFYFWDILLHDSMQNFMTQELRAASERNVFLERGASFAAVLTPFFLILWLFIVSGFLHLFLLMVRGAKAGYEATFRVVAYSVSPFVFLAIPVCGMPITALWVMTIAIIGLKEAHETTGGKAAFAVLFPSFCCGLLLLAMRCLWALLQLPSTA